MRRLFTRDRVIDVCLVLFCLLITVGPDLARPPDPVKIGLDTLASGILLFRRRYPNLVFGLTLLASAFNIGAGFAPLVALYTMAGCARSRWVAALGVVLTTAASMAGLVQPYAFYTEARAEYLLEYPAEIFWIATGIVFTFLAALAIIARYRRALHLRRVEIEEAREHEKYLMAQAAVAKERAHLAREMHDVVSHQVSLIAVQAAALQIGTEDQRARQAAGTIRELSAATLDELRHMVTLLRASGSASSELSPQPSLDDLRALLASSGIPVEFVGTLPTGQDGHTQRAIYRIVQESLTNVRKHAPGASATVAAVSDEGGLVLTITNTPPTHTVVPLPSAQHGLIGLRERAELLDGTLQAGATPDGGFQVRLRLPRRS